MRLERLGIIGSGAIAGLLIEALSRDLDRPLEAIAILGTPDGAARARAAFEAHVGRAAARLAAHADVEALIAERPDLVVECAGHDAVRDHVPALLRAGIDVAIVSIGALADDAVRTRLEAAADAGAARLILSSGALGGVDALAAARLAGLDEVVYTSRKPPLAWRGTPAEAVTALDRIACETVLFEGDARRAALAYPKNANVAAMVALAGPGFERTRVRLVADPAATGNTHELTVRSACLDMTISLTGRPMPDNPKTSTTTAYALAREVLNRVGAIAR